jgi:2,4-dienoyl-CoA reductase-like NADH-dependent reductase (Old Yellow Enzyme family)
MESRMTEHLFAPFTMRDATLSNRIVVSPMCQYSAVDGVPNAWHMQHLGSLSMSGAALLMTEATHVEAIGRITHGCLGLWNDTQEAEIKRIVDACRGFSPGLMIGMQLAHAGRKASSRLPWKGGAGLTPDEAPWQTVAPSALVFDDTRATPVALDRAGMDRIKAAFVQAAQRALRIGIDLIELHGAHGYLMHEFLSPIANRREDAYGGSLANRMRFPLEVFAAVRAVWPQHKPMGARITGSDWLDGGIDAAEAAAFAAELKARGCDYCCVSSGGIIGGAAAPRIPTEQGYQVPFADYVRRETGIATRAVGLLVEPRYADGVVREGKADMVAIARAFLDDPRWGWHAAQALGAPVPYPPQYERIAPKLWRGAQLARPEQTAA